MAQDLVTVFRSADPSAAEDAAAARETLLAAGIPADLLDDEAPGVPEGAWEVRVSTDQESAALAALRAEVLTPSETPDDSADMDLVTVFEGVGATGELEAMGIEAVLKASQIPVVTVGPSQIPTLSFLVQVPAEHAQAAQSAILEAQAAGPAAAEEGERESEAGAAAAETLV